MPLLFSDLVDEWDAALDTDDRYRALIEFGRRLPPMDAALKTAATKVPGCSADVWVYPLETGGLLHFQADSNADGALTADEYKNFVAKAKAGGGAPKSAP